jgi:hypothetical protein
MPFKLRLKARKAQGGGAANRGFLACAAKQDAVNTPRAQGTMIVAF